MSIPGPGRIVHIQDITECWPAIVTGVSHADRKIFMTVFPPNRVPQTCVIAYDSNGWHWPERDSDVLAEK